MKLSIKTCISCYVSEGSGVKIHETRLEYFPYKVLFIGPY